MRARAESPLHDPITAVVEAAVVEAVAVDSERAYRLRLCQRRRLQWEQTPRLGSAVG